MKLYYSPGACSIGIHFLLEEIGKPYELERILLKEGQQHRPEYLAVSPKSKVPALRCDDGTVLTEFPAIAFWVAASNPEAGFMPSDPYKVARGIEAVEYMVATIHMQGFARILIPQRFGVDEAEFETVRERGREMANKGLAIIEKTLGDKEFLLGDMSFADAALFYVSIIAQRAKLTLPASIADYWRRVSARPAARRVLEQEGVAA